MEKLHGKYGMTDFWKNKKIFITGHSGFKGSWLVSTLLNLGANVAGYSLIDTDRKLFELLKIESHIQNNWGDIRNSELLKQSLNRFKPDIIIHLAAQSLVQQSYIDPLETISTNIYGTASLLECCRNIETLKVILNVTSDKVYIPNIDNSFFKESAPLGGIDPYSASKSCSEIITRSYYESFLRKNEISLATARSGNVVGGGDWSKDRLVPDIIRSITDGKTLNIRHPNAIRPWQHVLDTIDGYLKLVTFLYNSHPIFESFNFGPSVDQESSVSAFLNSINEIYPQLNLSFNIETSTNHEEALIRLDSSNASKKLGWRNQYSFKQTVSKTIEWYLRYYNGEDAWQLTNSQILEHQKL
jgi:CDP-glucose 4,6-dehydratase